MSGRTSRHWCITSFNELITLNPENYIKTMEERKDASHIRYLIFQIERCPDTNRLHMQGYVELTQPCRMAWIKNSMFDMTIHCEIRKGTRLDAINYCKKEETKVSGPYEFGDAITQGHRSDLEQVAELIKKKCTITDVIDECPVAYIKFHRGIEKMMLHQLPKRTWKTRTFIVWGPTGSGKTSRVFHKYPNAYFLQRGNQKNLWFDGYFDQGCVVIDDFYNTIPYDTMLRLCDRYPCNVEYKGGITPFLAVCLVITTNLHPDQIYRDVPDSDAFWRRVDRIVHVGHDDIYETDRYGNRQGPTFMDGDIMWNLNLPTPTNTPVPVDGVI